MRIKFTSDNGLVYVFQNLQGLDLTLTPLWKEFSLLMVHMSWAPSSFTNPCNFRRPLQSLGLRDTAANL